MSIPEQAPPLPPENGTQVAVRNENGVAVLAVSGEVDLLTARGLRERLLSTLADEHRAVVVDLTEVDFFGSSGLAVLVEAKDAAAGRSELRIVATGPALRPLQMTGLTTMFPMYATREDALGDS